MKRRFIGFESTDQVDSAIKKERKRLAKGLPGSRVNQSVAVRSLIIRASTTSAKVGKS